MRNVQLTILTGLTLLAGAAETGCKPLRAVTSDVQAVTGVDGNGAEAALALVPVRNFTSAELTGGDAGSRQAAAMVKTRLFALVECGGASGANGVRIGAADLMAAVMGRAAIDDLYLDERRVLLTSADDDALAAFGTTSNKLVTLPCHLHGERLLSWAVLADIQMRAAGLPPQLPASGEVRERALTTYRTAQAIDLAVRGSYARSANGDFMPSLPAMVGMLSEQAGLTVSAAEIGARLRQADRLYNPCDASPTDDTAVPYAGALRNEDYTCVPMAGHPDMADYRAGGVSGTRYESTKDLIAAEIKGSHEVVFAAGAEQDPELYALWDLVTSVKPYEQQSLFDFAGRFASNAAGARAAGAYKMVRTAEVAAAPLVVALPESAISGSGDRRLVVIGRATGDASGRGVLQGGTASTADGRPSRASDRAKRLGRDMGGAGVSLLPALENGTITTLAQLRQPQATASNP